MDAIVRVELTLSIVIFDFQVPGIQVTPFFGDTLGQEGESPLLHPRFDIVPVLEL